MDLVCLIAVSRWVSIPRVSHFGSDSWVVRYAIALRATRTSNRKKFRRSSMTKLPEGIDFKGIYCYQNKNDPSTFFYLPREPKPEPDPQGKPTLTLWVSEQGAMLQ